MVKNQKSPQIAIYLVNLNWPKFWLGNRKEACDTIFPLRIWCLTTFGEEVWRNSAIGRFWRFFVAILAIFYPSPGYFFGWLGNFDSAYTEVLIGINSFADTTPGVVKLFRVSVLPICKDQDESWQGWLGHWKFSWLWGPSNGGQLNQYYHKKEGMSGYVPQKTCRTWWK